MQPRTVLVVEDEAPIAAAVAVRLRVVANLLENAVRYCRMIVVLPGGRP